MKISLKLPQLSRFSPATVTAAAAARLPLRPSAQPPQGQLNSLAREPELGVGLCQHPKALISRPAPQDERV